ncbi:MAG: flippase-like domain-containing protein [Thermoleophilia bacterium]|nr:flippase-like domain-containing protein [Thermoleophilia bacterium]
MTALLALRGRALAGGLSLALVAALVLAGDPGRLAEALRGRGLGVVTLVAALYLANSAAKALRWRILLGAAGVRAPFGAAYRAHLVGMSVNNLLPAGVAGEPVRLARLQGRVTRPGLAATGADRALDLVVIAAVAAGAVPLLAGIDPDLVGPLMALAAATGLVLLGLAALAWRRLGLGALARRPGPAIAAALLTVPIQANDAVRLMLVASLYGIDAGFWRALGIVAVATAAGMLTIVGAGAGLAATAAALLVAGGAPAADAAAVGLVFVATSTWISFPLGAAAVWAGRRDPRPTEARWT